MSRLERFTHADFIRPHCWGTTMLISPLARRACYRLLAASDIFTRPREMQGRRRKMTCIARMLDMLRKRHTTHVLIRCNEKCRNADYVRIATFHLTRRMRYAYIGDATLPPRADD